MTTNPVRARLTALTDLTAKLAPYMCSFLTHLTSPL